eukprot:TRINITY_DN3762_c0_g8_i1.p1 TRINITY_DN3762_c0_g8~~TRINITY_DN3762_c0_g8_i1.p1  ORF type:complete len:1321 (+),score=225.40 TRINITY_DN3762_c0_g8_i1:232-4194(+)
MGGLYQASDPFLVFLFFSLFGLSNVALCLLISTVFQKSKAANAFGSTFIMIATLPSMILGSASSKGSKIFWSFLSPTAFGLGAKLIMNEELNGSGASLSNLAQGSPSLLDYVIMLCVDTAIYMILAILFDTYSAADLMLLLRKALQKIKERASSLDSQDFVELDELVTVDETEPRSNDPANHTIILDNLRKIYPKSIFSPEEDIVAVDNLSLRLLPGSLLVLLGHNGAGKTTTISMLTGTQKPNSGAAFVNGLAINERMGQIRRSTGMCPQKSIIWDKLTVFETLKLYATIKSVKTDLIERECNYYIDLLELRDKAHTFCSTLSGGMKRKLSIAIALLGNSKIVFLDEPTAGMDPSSRRAVWDLLLGQKQHRTIILTTHLMDEADILGDQIGILVKGSLRSYGTPLELKSKYGSGYRLCCNILESFNSQDVLSHVQSFCQMARCLSCRGNEAQFLLPSDDLSSFSALFRFLDENAANLKIASYSISVTTLEEVFLKVLHEEDPAGYSMEETHTDRTHSVEALYTADSSRYQSNLHKLWNQTKLVCWRNRLSIMRETKKLLQIISLPFQAAVMFLLLFLVGLYGQGDESALPLTASVYPHTPIQVPYCCLQTVADTIAPILDYAADQSVDFNRITCPDRACGCLNDWTLEQHDIYSTVFLYSLAEQPSHFIAHVRYNTSAVHSIPITISALNNAFMSAALKSPKMSIEIYNQPLPMQGVLGYEFMNAYMVSIYIVMAISWLPGIFASNTSSEKQSLAFQQQRISGLSPFAYWMGTFVIDMAVYMVIIMIIMAILRMVGTESTVGESAGATFTLLLLFGTSSMPMAYIFTSIFEKYSTVNSALHFVNSFSSFIPIFIVSALEMTPSEGAQSASRIITYIFSIFPAFAVGSGLFHLELKHAEEIEHNKDSWSPWEWDIVGGKVAALMIDTVILWGILMSMEYKIVGQLLSQCWTPKAYTAPVQEERENLPPSQEPIDQDVKDEIERVDRMCGSTLPSDHLVLQRITKVYQTKEWFSTISEFRALEEVSMGIPKGMCFGLLGPNGAGKSTLMNIISNSLYPTAGCVYLEGIAIAESAVVQFPMLSSCPQSDPLFSHLTVREHMIYYGHLCGLREELLHVECDRLVAALQLTESESKLAGSLSGGTKRKLSLAIALLGKGSVILLDEPSSGMDPSARRFMLNEISRASHQSAVVLTTHSMEECEALCNRVTILTNGKQKCLGGIQHLKSKFSLGYQVEVLVPTSVAVEFKEAFMQHYPNAKLLDSHGYKMRWLLENGIGGLPELFEYITSHLSRYQIKDFSVSQTSLDQIFLNFARQQVYQPSLE